MNHSEGFTLIETLMVLAITAILFSLAAPSFSGFAQRQYVRNQTEAIVNLLTMARLYAIEQRVDVSVCPGTRDTGCTQSWNNGLLVYRQNRFNDSAETLLYQLQNDGHVHLKSNVSRLVFNYRGTVRGQAGSLIVCPNTANKPSGKLIVVNRGGRIRTLAESEAPDKKQCSANWRY